MNNKSEPFSVGGRLRSFTYALSGITEMVRSQQNAWVHAVATIAVIIAGVIFSVPTYQWCLLILVITAVWVVESLNTAFECLCDVVSPEYHPLVKKSKDVAAGAVLLSAIGAAIIGLIIFVPHLLNIF